MDGVLHNLITEPSACLSEREGSLLVISSRAFDLPPLLGEKKTVVVAALVPLLKSRESDTRSALLTFTTCGEEVASFIKVCLW